ncbi:MAG: PLP-dependent aminotransferase family protein [Velocimicrobium sp.]
MLTIPLDTTSKLALYEQIYRYIKNEIIQETLPFQSKLPSTRGLAAHLSISRNTVDMAYAQLLSEGYIEAFPKKGYFVSRITALNIINHTEFIKNPPITVSSKTVLPYLYDFSPFSVDLSHFPYQTWHQLSKNCLQDNADLFLLGDSQGDLSLRQAITHYLHQSRGVNCEEDQLIVGAGVDYLLQMLAQLFGTTCHIAMENPTYQRANKIFKGFKIKTIPIPLDSNGLNIDALERTDCTIAYVTPSHQYPLGIVMPIQRRIELLRWANKCSHRYIIEDDHDSEFRYKGKPIPSLQSIASCDNVIYIGTFSRAIAPAIRVGYMVLPKPLLEEYKIKFSYFASTVSRIDQAILTEFINEGYFERHLNRMRKVYKTKHDLILSSLKSSNLPIAISGENAGMHLVVQLTNGMSEESIIKRAKNNQIKLYGLKEHFFTIPKNYDSTFLFGYANLSEADIQKGIHQFATTCF